MVQARGLAGVIALLQLSLPLLCDGFSFSSKGSTTFELAHAITKYGNLTWSEEQLKAIPWVQESDFPSIIECAYRILYGEGETSVNNREITKLQLMRQNDLKNGLVMWMFPESWGERLPRWVQSWLRNFVFGMAIYLVVNTLWCIAIYQVFRKRLFPKGDIPTFDAVFKQILVSLSAIPLYTFLPVVIEHCVDNGWTKTYPLLDNKSWVQYGFDSFLYLISVEFGVYWMHRMLHDIKPAYKYLHSIHHSYNKEDSLSPFAGLAFHPIDGILQAVPYFVSLCYFPCHALTYEILLFMTAFWTSNIHDCVVLDVWPIMGSAYHVIHHTSYRHNYGHYTILFDWMFGTLYVPETITERRKSNESKKVQ